MGYWIVWSSQVGLLNVGSAIGLIVLLFAATSIVKANRLPVTREFDNE